MFIYGLVDPSTGKLRYVGLSTRGAKRPMVHIYDNPRGRSHHANWLRSLRRRGLRPEWLVLERCADKATLSAAEKFWITYFRTRGFDLTNSEDGGFNGSPSAEARAKMSAAKKGRKLSPEFCAVLAVARRKPRSAEAREHIRQAKLGARNPMFGTKRSEAARAATSAANRGANNPNYGGKAVTAYQRERARETMYRLHARMT